MAARSLSFRQADVSRALKGAKSAGMDVGRIEIAPGGRMILWPKGDSTIEAEDVLAKWEADYRAGQT